MVKKAVQLSCHNWGSLCKSCSFGRAVWQELPDLLDKRFFELRKKSMVAAEAIFLADSFLFEEEWRPGMCTFSWQNEAQEKLCMWREGPTHSRVIRVKWPEACVRWTGCTCDVRSLQLLGTQGLWAGERWPTPTQQNYMDRFFLPPQGKPNQAMLWLDCMAFHLSITVSVSDEIWSVLTSRMDLLSTYQWGAYLHVVLLCRSYNLYYRSHSCIQSLYYVRYFTCWRFTFL